MFDKTNRIIEEKLLLDVFSPKRLNLWDSITGKDALCDLLIDWFCTRILSSKVLFPSDREDKQELFLATYAFGVILAASTTPMNTRQIATAAGQQYDEMFDTRSVSGVKFALQRSRKIHAYEQSLLDSTKGCNDVLTALLTKYINIAHLSNTKESRSYLVEVATQWIEHFIAWDKQLDA